MVSTLLSFKDMETQTKSRENISTIFLLPTLQIKKDLKNAFRKNGFMASYIYCNQYNFCNCFKPLFLLFKPQSFSVEFYRFNVEMEKSPNFVETVDLPEQQVLMVFKVPKLFENDYELIEMGRYSKTSAEFRKLFPMGKDSNFYHIFTRSDKLKSDYMKRLNCRVEDLPQELYSRMKISEETLVWME